MVIWENSSKKYVSDCNTVYQPKVTVRKTQSQEDPIFKERGSKAEKEEERGGGSKGTIYRLSCVVDDILTITIKQ